MSSYLKLNKHILWTLMEKWKLAAMVCLRDSIYILITHLKGPLAKKLLLHLALCDAYTIWFHVHLSFKYFIQNGTKKT